MRPYRVNLTAGGSQDVPAAGSYVYAIATPGGPVTVHAYDVNGALVLEGSLHAGRGLLCPPFVRLHIENGATAQLIEIQAGFGQVQDVGLVSVAGVVETAPDFSRVMEGKGFVAAGGRNPLAGQYSVVQLLNPAANPKNIVVPRLQFSPGVSGCWLKVGAGVLPAPTIARPGVNLFAGDAASSAGIFGQYLAAPFFAAPGDMSFLSASELVTSLPLVLAPGQDVTFHAAAVNESLTLLASFFEVKP